MGQINYRQQGIILAVVLLFSFLLSLLVLAAMDTAVLQTKIAHNDNEQRSIFEAAEAGLIQAEQEITENKKPKCKTASLLENLTQQSYSWWRQQCKGNFPDTNVFYVIEEYNYKPCINLNKTGKRIINYFRLSSYARGKQNSAPVILQTTYAYPSDKPCNDVTHAHVEIGRLSWGQLK